MSDHDVCGDGPVLLVVPGGAGHPMGLGPLTRRLAERFTVVTYDPLGLAHGRLGRPVADQRVEEWSDGARDVLEAVLPDGESAYVLGASSGGIAALDLLARHPRRLRHVVAHEPPCVAALPDGARQRAAFREVYDTYRAAGPAAAAERLAATLEERTPDAVPDGQPLTRAEELSQPMALFLAHVLVPFTSYVPHLTAPAAARLTLAAGDGHAGGFCTAPRGSSPSGRAAPSPSSPAVTWEPWSTRRRSPTGSRTHWVTPRRAGRPTPAHRRRTAPHPAARAPRGSPRPPPRPRPAPAGTAASRG